MNDPSFATTQDPGLDELIVGGPVKTATVTLTENQGQGALTRGAVLGYAASKYARVHQTGSYPATTAVAVLAKDADPSGGDVEALVYVMADVNENKLNFGGTVVAANVRKPLQDYHIFLKQTLAG